MKVVLLWMFFASLCGTGADESSGSNVPKLEEGWRGRLKRGTSVSDVASWYTGPGTEAKSNITGPLKAETVDANLRGHDPCCPAADGKCYSCQSGDRCYACKSCRTVGSSFGVPGSTNDQVCYCYACSGSDGNCYNYDCGNYCSDTGCVGNIPLPSWPFEKSYYP
ncbi:unnamed protein product [Symbiodinium pilosum]|uniref:Uncharacterized protein n=1 Tax=Symbiodinium pilosum TaxID=2952 RepID=A0A812XSB8_SYMPI|nr:unnamed protein product [Symbiodinium pilosum]